MDTPAKEPPKSAAVFTLMSFSFICLVARRLRLSWTLHSPAHPPDKFHTVHSALPQQPLPQAAASHPAWVPIVFHIAVLIKQSFDHNFFLIKCGQNLSVGSQLPRALCARPLSLTPGTSVQSLLLGEPFLPTALPRLVSPNLTSCTLTGDTIGQPVTRVAGHDLASAGIARRLCGSPWVIAGVRKERPRGELGQGGREPGAKQ